MLHGSSIRKTGACLAPWISLVSFLGISKLPQFLTSITPEVLVNRFTGSLEYTRHWSGSRNTNLTTNAYLMIDGTEVGGLKDPFLREEKAEAS